MTRPLRIALVGDRDPAVPAHVAIPIALERAAALLGVAVQPTWMPTDRLDAVHCLDGVDGLWCVPASPYRSMAGALLAIRFARETALPFLGTCGGFQHAVLEYARHVLGWADAEHAETSPDAACALISPLSCALVDTVAPVHLRPGSQVAAAYASGVAEEGYRCRYGLNPAFAAALLAGPLQASGHDDAGEVRAIDLTGHPFFVATLFQPERAALVHRRAPLVEAFVRACVAAAAATAAA